MGKVIVDIRVQNYNDIVAEKGVIRSIEIKGAVVDTGATLLGLRKKEIDELGLKLLRRGAVITATGKVEKDIYGIARVEIMDRECEVSVVEVPDDVPPLIGYMVLEGVDLIVDTSNHTLIGNPQHGGKFMFDLLYKNCI